MSSRKETLSEQLTESFLRDEAGSRSYERGEMYYEEGRVHKLNVTDTKITGEVKGTYVYHTSFELVDDDIECDCSCPLGMDGNFCKHLVALGLTYLRSKRKNSRNKPEFQWETYLNGCDKAVLIKIILEMSENNQDVIEKYRLSSAQPTGPQRTRALKEKVDELFDMAEEMIDHYDDFDYDYDSYDNEDADEYNQQSTVLFDVLERLAEQDEYQLLWDISTYGIDKFLTSEDLDNYAVQSFIEDMMEYFHKAVHAGVKRAEEVIIVFLEWEKQVTDCGGECLTILGKALKELPASVRKLWSTHALEVMNGYAQSKLGRDLFDSVRGYYERHLLEWAEESHDDSLKLKIMEKNLSSESDVKRLAEEYRRQGMEDKVFPLLKRGYDAFSNSWELFDLYAEKLLEAGEGKKVLDLAWKKFTDNLLQEESLDRLQKLSSSLKCWPAYKEKVLSYLEELEKKSPKTRKSTTINASDLRRRRIEILFELDKQQQAWDLSQGVALPEHMQMKLVEWRAWEVPEESAAIIRKKVESALIPTGEAAYVEVVRYLKLYRKYMTMAGKTAEFAAYCASIRTEYKRRRLLLQQMDKAKL